MPDVSEDEESDLEPRGKSRKLTSSFNRFEDEDADAGDSEDAEEEEEVDSDDGYSNGDVRKTM